MIVAKKYFKIFKKECNFWIKKLELSEWRIELYLDEDCKQNRAYVEENSDNMWAVIYLCTIWLKQSQNSDEEKIRQIKEASKHECIHLLIGKIMSASNTRFIGQRELDIEEEALVRKLEKILC